MTTVPGRVGGVPSHPWRTHEASEADRHEWGFVVQAVSGAAVLLLVTAHMIANHFVVPGGLRDFAGVVAYLASPAIVVLETAFLATVSIHALAGVRAIMFDLGLSSRVERWVTRGLAVIGVLTVGYGLWLTAVITAQG